MGFRPSRTGDGGALPRASDPNCRASGGQGVGDAKTYVRSRHRRRLPVGNARRRGSGQDLVPDRLVDLCRLDALGLCRRCRNCRQVGKEVRHRDRGRADQRLRRIDQSIHRRRLRRLCDDQHGRAHHSGGGWDRQHGAHHRRLLQRQRRDSLEERARPQGPLRGIGQSGRAVGLPLPAGAGAGERGSGRARPRRHRQHL